MIVEKLEHRVFLFVLQIISIHAWAFNMMLFPFLILLEMKCYIEDMKILQIPFFSLFFWRDILLSFYLLWIGCERTIVNWESNGRKMHFRLCLEVLFEGDQYMRHWFPKVLYGISYLFKHLVWIINEKLMNLY